MKMKISWQMLAGWLAISRLLNATVQAQSVYAPYTFTTLAGGGPGGSVDGMGGFARFHYPYGVAVDSAGNIYVADTRNHTSSKVTSLGVVTTLAGLVQYIDRTSTDAGKTHSERSTTTWHCYLVASP